MDFALERTGDNGSCWIVRQWNPAFTSAYGNSDGLSHIHTDADAHAYTDLDADCNPNLHADAHADADCHRYANANPVSDANEYEYADTHPGDAHTDEHFHPHAHIDSRSVHTDGCRRESGTSDTHRTTTRPQSEPEPRFASPDAVFSRSPDAVFS